MDSLEANYVALLNLPIVKELLRKNKKLRKENKSLKNLVYSLPEFRCVCHRSSETRTVRIKKEPRNQEEPTECEPLAEDEDEVVFVEAEKQNIVYVIDEQDDELDELDDDDLAEEQDEAEEEAEAEEEEADEEEADEEEPEEEAEEEEQDEAEEEQDETEVEEQEEADEEQEEADEEQEEAEGAEEEVFEVQVSGKSYYTSDQKNGKIYAITADEEIGDEVGVFVDGKAKFHKK